MSTEPHPFDELMEQPESEIRLAHAALLWACDEYQDLAPARYLDRLNGLADRVDAANADDASERLVCLRQILVDTESFRGNHDDFANPANSYLNKVIDTRRGIPVSLGTIWLDVAEQLQWPLHGMATPGHFLLRYDSIGEDVLIDPFSGGREVTRDECTVMLSRIFGPDFSLTDEHLAPVGPHAVLARMLGNLYATYVNAGDWIRTTRILRRLVAIRTDEALLRAELGRMQLLIGEIKEAAVTLNKALELAETDEEISTVKHHLVDLRSKLREQN